MKGKRKGRIYKLLAVLGMIALLCPRAERVYAAPETSTTGSITIQLSELNAENSNKEGVKFTYYQVGTWDTTFEKWKLVDALSGTNVDFSALKNNGDWDNAAKTLETSASLLSGTETTTNEEGQLELTDLPLGMYLMIPEENNNYGVMSPFLVGLPGSANGSYSYAITVNPKAKANQKPGEPPATPTTPTPSAGNGGSGGSSSEEESSTPAPVQKEKQAAVIQPLLTTVPVQPRVSVPRSVDHLTPEKEFIEETVNEETAEAPVEEETIETETETEVPETTLQENPDDGDGIPALPVVVGVVSLGTVAGGGSYLFTVLRRRK